MRSSLEGDALKGLLDRHSRIRCKRLRRHPMHRVVLLRHAITVSSAAATAQTRYRFGLSRVARGNLTPGLPQIPA